MPTKSGIVLNDSEVLNEHGIIERHKTAIPAKTPVWLHYNTYGRLIVIERKYDTDNKIKKPLLGNGE